MRKKVLLGTVVVLLFFILILQANVANATNTSSICGDVNGDNTVNGTDVTYLGKYLNGIQGYTVIEETADVNDDGVIDWKDYSILKKHIAGETGYEELPKPYACGDLNRDYLVNETDIAYLGRTLNGSANYPVIIEVGDANSDGEVDWKDYSILKKYIAEETGYEQLPKTYACGDINRDYEVNETDITYLGRNLNENVNYPVITKLGDVNDDGQIDWKDYIILKKYIAEETGYEQLPKTYSCGDVNKDYEVNIIDITYLGRNLNGNVNYPVITKLGDVNEDGVIDWKDYSILKKHIAGERGYETLPYDSTIIVEYNLIFMSDNEEYARTSYVPGTQTVEYLTAPTKTGYKFVGWFEANLTESHIFSTMPNEDITVYAVWIPTWMDEGTKDEENKTITYTINTQEKLEQLNLYITEIEENTEYKHIFNISGDLQFDNQIIFNENSTVNILGTLEMNNNIVLKGATVSLLTTQETGLNISGNGGIKVNATANLIIDGKSLVGNETTSCIDLASNEQNEEEIFINKNVVTAYNINGQPFTMYGIKISITRGIATLKNANVENTDNFKISRNDILKIESNGKLIVDYNMTVEGTLDIVGELAIDENKTVTLIDDATMKKEGSNVTGLGELIDNRDIGLFDSETI